MASPICVVAGFGPGNGAAFTGRFASEGYRVAMLARSEGPLREMEAAVPAAKGYAVDLTDSAAVREAFERIGHDLGPVDVLVHNAARWMMKPFLETTPEELDKVWRANAFSFFLCGRHAANDMLASGRGAIIAIGATASVRSGPNFAAFASSKAAMRSLAQSMARDLGPRGIHVAYAVIDGAIDTPRIRAMIPGQKDEFFLQPDAIADTVFHLAGQDPSGLDLRGRSASLRGVLVSLGAPGAP